jgi:hypothetical protein
LKKQISECKNAYKRKIEQWFVTDPKACWNGMKAITGYSQKKNDAFDGREEEWCKRLNDFYARFEKPDITPMLPSADHHEPMVHITEDEVRRVFLGINASKAPGPDRITPRTLKTFAQELSPIFCQLFNNSLSNRTVPDVWKTSIIVPIAKKPSPKEPNDYRPVALTSVVMKSMEKIVLRHLIEVTGESLDPLQFAYRQNRGTDDACTVLTHQIVSHLETIGNYTRILFVDFSSAFNTMLPSVLIEKLCNLGVPPSLCQWLLSYLRGRTQKVRIGSTYSKSNTTNIGAPQGCVLSPVLFTHYTNDHRGEAPHTYVVKYADDTAILGLIGKNGEGEYRNTVETFVRTCDGEGLILNVGKTKEMVVDFRKKPAPLNPLLIKGEAIETCKSYKYLGLTISEDLTWEVHVDTARKKAMKKNIYTI